MNHEITLYIIFCKNTVKMRMTNEITKAEIPKYIGYETIVIPNEKKF